MDKFINCVMDFSHGVYRYEVDIRIAACEGYSDWYQEAAHIATNVVISFYDANRFVGSNVYHKGNLVEY